MMGRGELANTCVTLPLLASSNQRLPVLLSASGLKNHQACWVFFCSNTQAEEDPPVGLQVLGRGPCIFELQITENHSGAVQVFKPQPKHCSVRISPGMQKYYSTKLKSTWNHARFGINFGTATILIKPPSPLHAVRPQMLYFNCCNCTNFKTISLQLIPSL